MRNGSRHFNPGKIPCQRICEFMGSGRVEMGRLAMSL